MLGAISLSDKLICPTLQELLSGAVGSHAEGRAEAHSSCPCRASCVKAGHSRAGEGLPHCKIREIV